MSKVKEAMADQLNAALGVFGRDQLFPPSQDELNQALDTVLPFIQPRTRGVKPREDQKALFADSPNERQGTSPAPVSDAEYATDPAAEATGPTFKPQSMPYDDPASCNFFRPSAEKPFVMTRGASAVYGVVTIVSCLERLQREAKDHGGLDYLQIFTGPFRTESLWFIEDGTGGASTALLPSEY